MFSGSKSHEIAPLDRFLTLAEAAKRIPGQPHISTLHRWRLRGVRGVRLLTKLIGGRRYVTEADLEEFVIRINQTDDGVNSEAPTPSANLKKAESLLDREGV